MGKSSSNNNKSKKVGFAEEEVKVAVKAEPQEDELQQEPQEVEQWDVTKVIDQNNEDERCVCRKNECEGANAVLVWKSTLDPQGDDVWPMCVPCSKDDFGTLPEGYKHLDTIADGAAEEDGGATAIDATDGADAKEESNNKDETAIDTLAAEVEEIWDLKQIIPKEEIEQFPVQCDEEGCTLLGAVVWTCTKTTPHQKWRACLDCQVIIYFLDFVICF